MSKAAIFYPLLFFPFRVKLYIAGATSRYHLKLGGRGATEITENQIIPKLPDEQQCAKLFMHTIALIDVISLLH